MTKAKCILCESPDCEILRSIERKDVVGDSLVEYKITEDKADLTSLRIVRCLKCGLVSAWPRESVETIYAKYQCANDDTYFSEEKGRRAAAKIILRKISPYAQKGKILDIGCGTGFLLDEAKKQGWDPHGVELCTWAVNIAKKEYALNVFEGVLEKADFPCNYFDVITMTDLIEHIPDPKKILKEVRRILKEDGIFYISTPDIDSFLSKFLGVKWWGIQQSHLFYFNKKTVGKILDATGFHVLEYTSHARVFSGKYLCKRLNAYSIFLSRLFNFILEKTFFQDRLFKVNFRDQIDVFTRKNLTFESVGEDNKTMNK